MEDDVNPGVADKQLEKQTERLWLKPWQFKPGHSGNPKGRPKGSKSLKQFAKEYLESLPDEEKLDYMKGMDKSTIWEMAEGKPKQDVEGKVEITSKVISVDE